MSGGGPDGAGFLSRWSRRKQQARAAGDGLPDAAREQRRVETVPTAGGGPVAEADESTLSDAELLAKYELPDPASLTASDDVAVFMRKNVPARLRSLALRRIWRLDPVLANLDGLNDYDEDYTDAAMLAGVVKTTYQVGRGGAAHLQDAADRLAAGDRPSGPEREPEPGPEPQPGEDRTADAGHGENGITHENVMTAPDAEAGDVPGPRPPVPMVEARQVPAETPRRRRMVFATQDVDGLHTGSRHSDK